MYDHFLDIGSYSTMVIVYDDDHILFLKCLGAHLMPLLWYE